MPKHYTSKKLSDWLTHISKCHTKEIDLGLTRIREVARSLNLLPLNCTKILVGGTNGKGSTVAILAKIYSEAGYKVATFTSPYLLNFNEQIKIGGNPINDAEICALFNKIEAQRNNIPLTLFEFTTLAALNLFAEQQPDVAIIEVGVGGATDATNIIEPDISIITNIELDHTAWLGKNRNEIAQVKAGILRANKPAVFGDKNPPPALLEQSNKIKSELQIRGRNYDYKVQGKSFNWQNKTTILKNLPTPSLPIENAATALAAIMRLQKALKTSLEAIKKGLAAAKLPGHFQIIMNPVVQILDVAHNPHSINYLANKLKANNKPLKTIAVFSMLHDKDISSSVATISGQIDSWHIAKLKTERAASKKQLIEAFNTNKINYKYHADIINALSAAINEAKLNDRIVVFGSFHTVAAILKNTVLSDQTTKL